jgi:hypothetical protein
MKRVRAELMSHVGGKPSAVQRQLIERAVRLSLQLELMDERLTHAVTFKTRDHNHYLAWSNALTRTLARLGLSPSRTAPPLPNPGRGVGLAELMAGQESA